MLIIKTACRCVQRDFKTQQKRTFEFWSFNVYDKVIFIIKAEILMMSESIPPISKSMRVTCEEIFLSL